MTDLQTRIMAVLRGSVVRLTGEELAAQLGEPKEAVADALHALDDAGDVMMRNGLYHPSQAHWARFRDGAV